MRRITFLLITCSTFFTAFEPGRFCGQDLAPGTHGEERVTLADGCRAIYYFMAGMKMKKTSTQ